MNLTDKIDELRIKRVKQKITALEGLYKISKNEYYLEQIKEEHKKIRSIQAKNMEKF